MSRYCPEIPWYVNDLTEEQKTVNRNRRSKTWRQKPVEELNSWELYQKKYNFVELDYPCTFPYKYGCDYDSANSAFYIKDYRAYGKSLGNK